MNANAFEERTFEVMESFQRNVQQILVLGRDKRANEMVRRTVQSLNVFLRIVPFIENQCNALTFLFEHLVAGDQIVQYLAKGDSIVLVSFVGLGKQRDMEIPGNQQRQADNAEIRAFGLGVAALSQLARVVRRKESVEVGGVVKKRSQINIQPFNHSPRNVIFDLRNSRLVKIVHVVPEALTPQGCRVERKKPNQNGVPVPGGEFALACRRKRPIQGCQQYILAHRSPLVSFRGVAVDRADNIQLLSHVPECGGGTEVALLGVERPSRSPRQTFKQLLSGADMAHHAHARLSMLIAIGFHDAPVAFSPNRVVLDARHDSYIPNLAQAVNENRNMLWWRS